VDEVARRGSDRRDGLFLSVELVCNFVRDEVQGSEEGTVSRSFKTVDSHASETLVGHDEILRLHAAAVEANLGDSRAALLASIDQRIIAGLPQLGSPGDQILSDLGWLNAVGTLPDGSAPLAFWLANAAELSEPRSQAGFFRAVLSRSGLVSALDAGARLSIDSEGLPAARTTRWIGRRLAISALVGMLVAGPMAAVVELEKRLTREREAREEAEHRVEELEIDLAVQKQKLTDCKAERLLQEQRCEERLQEERRREQQPKKRAVINGQGPSTPAPAVAPAATRPWGDEGPTDPRLPLDPSPIRRTLREHRVEGPSLRQPAVSPNAGPTPR
jgi:hypothetical protein